MPAEGTYFTPASDEDQARGDHDDESDEHWKRGVDDDIEPDAAGTFRAFQYRHRRPEDHFDEHLMVLGGSVAYIPMF